MTNSSSANNRAPPLKAISAEPIILYEYKGRRDARIVNYTQEDALEDYARERERRRALEQEERARERTLEEAARARRALEEAGDRSEQQPDPEVPAVGWGSMFESQTVQRTCAVCFVKFHPDAARCPACGAAVERAEQNSRLHFR